MAGLARVASTFVIALGYALILAFLLMLGGTLLEQCTRIEYAPSVTTARLEMGSLLQVLALHWRERRSLPRTLRDLTIPGPGGAPPYLRRVPLDPWGNEFEYESGDQGVRLRSYGEDGLPDTEDDLVLERRIGV